MISINEHSDIMCDFIKFIHERHDIYINKEILKQPAPWTCDTILSTGKFGNIWRQLDRGTKFELDNIKLRDIRYDNETTRRVLRSQLMFILVYRHNLIPVVTKALLDSWKYNDSMYNILYRLDLKYYISDVIKIYPLYGDNIHSIVNDILYVVDHMQDVVMHIDMLVDYFMSGCKVNPYEAFLLIQHLFPRLGEFKAYEVVTSISYLRQNFWSEDDFCYVGHGAVDAIHLLINDNNIDDKFLPLYLPQLRDIVNSKINTILLTSQYNFTVRTVEDCACEFRKYLQVKEGIRPNRPYPDNLGRWTDADNK